MTRINCGIEPEELTRLHLLAEHREIVRVPNCIKKGRFNLKGQPKEFTLGEGHVKFFYDKLLYLKKRYLSIHSECVKRGYNVTDFSTAFEGIKPEFMKDYKPSERDRSLIRLRIQERLTKQ